MAVVESRCARACGGVARAEAVRASTRKYENIEPILESEMRVLK
jgi:hypothetical protein